MTQSRDSEMSPSAIVGVLFATAVILMVFIGLLYEFRLQDAEQSIDRLRTELRDNRGEVSDLRIETRSEASDDRIATQREISDLRMETRSEASEDRIATLREISDLRIEIGRTGR